MAIHHVGWFAYMGSAWRLVTSLGSLDVYCTKVYGFERDLFVIEAWLLPPNPVLLYSRQAANKNKIVLGCTIVQPCLPGEGVMLCLF